MVENVKIENGIVLCDLRDIDKPNKNYSNIPILTPLNGEVISPPTGSEVLLGRIYGGQLVIIGTLSAARSGTPNESDAQAGGNNGYGSVAFSFGPRDGATEPEQFEITYSSTGYHIRADVDGPITLESGGDITLKATSGNIVLDQGDTPKKVLTEDAVFEYEDTGDTQAGGGGSTTKTTSTVSNGEKTDTKID